MQIFRREQTLNFDNIDPYAISHPLTQQRVAHIRANVSEEENLGKNQFDQQHLRIVAKLEGFMEKPNMFLPIIQVIP